MHERSVLLLTQDFPPRPGGMGRYYADLAAGWGLGFTVLSGSWGGVAPVSRAGERVLPLDGVDAARAHTPRALWRARRQLRRELESSRPGLLLAGNIRPYAMPLRRAAAMYRLPWGFFLHGRDLIRTATRWQHHPLKRLRWRALRDARVIIANSRFTAEEAVRRGFPSQRIAVVTPEVDTTRFVPPSAPGEREQARQRLGLPAGPLLSLFVGRLVERKGLADLFAALALVPDARLIVAGAGDVAPWRARAQAAGVADRVHFAGSPAQAELPVWYRAADLFVAPSWHDLDSGEVEGFGIVFLEAQAAGLPVLATRAGGIPEAVQEGRTALLVPPRDVRALAAAWQEFHDNAGMRQAFAAAAPGGPPRDHGPGSSARQLREALEALLPPDEAASGPR